MIHPTAQVDSRALIGEGTKIWNYVQVREGVRIGKQCIVGKDAYVDLNVQIGDNCKIQNGAKIYHGATLEDGVFVGPQACVLNDKNPRAITPDGNLKSDSDWDVGRVLIRYGASIGGGALVLPNVTVGKFALIAAGAVVSRNVPDHALVVGNPARFAGYVCECARRLVEQEENGARVWVCEHDHARFALDANGNLTKQG
jgi:UDP-2-acetamido-3-amino-2,3-dideoxy-glucuronate N-acetyltransferase